MKKIYSLLQSLSAFIPRSRRSPPLKDYTVLLRYPDYDDADLAANGGAYCTHVKARHPQQAAYFAQLELTITSLDDYVVIAVFEGHHLDVFPHS